VSGYIAFITYTCYHKKFISNFNTIMKKLYWKITCRFLIECSRSKFHLPCLALIPFASFLLPYLSLVFQRSRQSYHQMFYLFYFFSFSVEAYYHLVTSRYVYCVSNNLLCSYLQRSRRYCRQSCCVGRRAWCWTSRSFCRCSTAPVCARAAGSCPSAHLPRPSRSRLTGRWEKFNCKINQITDYVFKS